MPERVIPIYDHGGITLYHGDCLALLPSLAWDVLITDPPYGINLDNKCSRPATWSGKRIAGDTDTTARAAVLDAHGDRPAAVFGSWKVARPEGARALLTWDKGMACGMGDLSIPWKPNTEEIYILGAGWTGHRGSSVLSYPITSWESCGRTHPTEKPVPLLQALIAKAPPGVILDPFAGTGSTLVAAKNLGRKAIGIEIDADYCKVIVRRLAQECLALEVA